MRSTNARILKVAFAAAALLAAGLATATTTTVNLTAQRSTTVLPDGATVPMWGYCTPDTNTVPGATAGSVVPNPALGGGTLQGGAACTTTNTRWATGPTIVVPYGNSLTINLTNSLPTPTSIVILGQVLGGGLGAPSKIPSPAHTGQTQTTWPVQGDAPVGFTPPDQVALGLKRVMSFGTEVAANGTLPATLTWPSAPGGATVKAHLAPGTYIYEAGTHPSIQVPMGLYGVLVVTCPPSAGVDGQAYPTSLTGCNAAAGMLPAASTVPYDADQVVLLSEADPVQNNAVDAAAVSTALCPALVGACTGTINEANYPAAVNYAPTYFFVNGMSYDPTNPAATEFAPNPPAIATGSSGNVLVRFANAGSRTHVPTIVGLPMTVAAEDGHVLPGAPRIQNEVLLTAGKTHDVLVQPVTKNLAGVPTGWRNASFGYFDRELSLSTANLPHGGIQGQFKFGTAGLTSSANLCGFVTSRATFLVPYNAMSYSGNVLAGQIGLSGVMFGAPSSGTLTASDPSGTFTVSFGAPFTSGTVSVPITATCTNSLALATQATITGAATLQATTAIAAPILNNSVYTAANAVALSVPAGKGLAINQAALPAAAPYSALYPYPLRFALDTSVTPTTSCAATVNPDGSFAVALSAAMPSCTFNVIATSSQGLASNSAAVVVNFPVGNGPAVTVVDAQNGTPITDYRWLIEEDRTYHTPVGATPTLIGNELGSNFHNSQMPVVAAGCTGPKSCRSDPSYVQTLTNAVTNPATGLLFTAPAPDPVVTPDQVVLDPTKYYFISVLTGDAADAFAAGNVSNLCQGTTHDNADCGHSVSGAAIAAAGLGGAFAPVVVKAEPTPQTPAQISVFIYEDSAPINGAPDGNEETQGLGGFEIVIFDPAGRTGDVAGQVTYDVNNMPLTNALVDTFGWVVNTDTPSDVDLPGQLINLCPSSGLPQNAATAGLVGVIYTCPDGSALAGQAQVKNLEPGRYDVIAHPSGARMQAGEVWIQTETLEGTPAQDAFAKVNEPTYFQEFGPPGPHTTIGFANPKHVAAALAALTNPGKTHTVTGRITNLHMSRPSDVRLYDSQSREPLSQTTCWVALNSSGGTGQALAMQQCDAQGNFTINGVPEGAYEIVYWDEWLDQIISSKAVTIAPTSPATVALGDIGAFSWFTRVETSYFLDVDGTHVPPALDSGNIGISNELITIRYRDGSISSRLQTDSSGSATFAELFPLFNWYVVESDSRRFKSEGVDVWVDAGGVPDGVPGQGGATHNAGSPYVGILNSSYVGTTGSTTHRWDPASIWTGNPFLRNTAASESEGIQGFVSQTAVLNWAKVPYAANENGGITGIVIYGSTRAFDDPRMFVQNIWDPLVPNVTVNLYSESLGPDGVTPVLTYVTSTTTSSWDDAVHRTTNPMSCPGMNPADPFVQYTLGSANITKCFDGFRAFNQTQPAPYNGRYAFKTDAVGNPLPAGLYVVEVVPPEGYEIVKEEDKNILVGDAWIAPAAEQFNGLANVFILPDQATLNNANPKNPGQSNPTTNLGTDRADTPHAPCVGTIRQVPDFLSLFPNVQQVAPFAGALKPLCDRKEVNLEPQMQANADFAVFTKVPIAAHFTGMILDDAASEFNPASPAFGEKFAVPFNPISMRDWNGVEITRLHSDQWGMYNGLAPSSWEVNVPNPAGYSPNMIIACMNDPGPVPVLDANGVQVMDPTTGKPMLANDPLYNRMYSNFCYTLPFMPGLTSYLDTPVVPTAAFADGYDPVDCEYPNYTPAVGRVDGNWAPPNAVSGGPTSAGGGIGPYLELNNNNKPLILSITSMSQTSPVLNPAYVGPTSILTPYSGNAVYGEKMITRDYSFGTTKGKVMLGSTDVSSCSSWTPTLITVNLTACNTPAPGAYQLSITAANGKSSIDAITVTVADSSAGNYRPPHYVPPGQSIQAVVDGILDHTTGVADPNYKSGDASKVWPGDLILLDAGQYPELVVLWMPLRLQGVGAASTVINAAKYPTNKLEDWRTEVNLLFLGTPLPAVGTDTPANPQVQPLPGQEIADQILAGEPVVLADAEGAGITVLGIPDCRVMDNPPLNQDPTFGVPGVDSCPAGSYGNTLFDQTTGAPIPNTNTGNFSYRDPSHPSRIDGLTVTGGDSGGGIFIDGWAHNLEVSNNRVYGNAGVYAGGIRVGQPYLEDSSRGPLNYNMNIRIHNNAITTNGALESNTGNGGAGGGLSISSGADHYRVDQNFICGNSTQDDGGGIGHIGVSTDGQITHNWILFNESFNPTTTQSGGGIAIEGEPANNGGVDAGVDTTAPTYGTGSVLIDSNMIVGNFAKGGHGGGIYLLDVNGDDVEQSPRNMSKWYAVTIVNNYIADNVAAWSGGGISLQDVLLANINNNTIVRNDSTATAGAVFSKGAYTNYANAQVNSITATQSYFWPAGVSSQLHAATFGSFLGSMSAGGGGGGGGGNNSAITAKLRSTYSDPNMQNDIIWGNRSFYFTATPPPDTTGNPTYGLTSTLMPVLTQTATGSCNPLIEMDWDVGVVGYGPNNPSQTHLHPTNSILTNKLVGQPAPSYYSASGNQIVAANAANLVNKSYCNGSRVPVGLGHENGQIPPFEMIATSAEDESGNFVDVHYGPLSTYDLVLGAAAGDSWTQIYGDYRLTAGANRAVDAGTFPTPVITHDYFGTTRPQGISFDVGAQEVVEASVSVLQLQGSPLAFGTVNGGSSATLSVTLIDPASAPITGLVVPAVGTVFGDFTVTATDCTAVLNAASTCTVTVKFAPTAVGLRTGQFTVSGAATSGTTQFTVTMSGTGRGSLTRAPNNIVFTTNFVGRTSGATNHPVTLTGGTSTGGNVSISFACPNQVQAGTKCVTSAFAQTNNCPATLAAGQTCTVWPTFTAQAPAGSTSVATLRFAGANTTSPTTGLQGTSK